MDSNKVNWFKITLKLVKVKDVTGRKQTSSSYIPEQVQYNTDTFSDLNILHNTIRDRSRIRPFGPLSRHRRLIIADL